jgi:hypothetical protein
MTVVGKPLLSQTTAPILSVGVNLNFSVSDDSMQKVQYAFLGTERRGDTGSDNFEAATLSRFTNAPSFLSQLTILSVSNDNMQQDSDEF